jgi:hypothetical protein
MGNGEADHVQGGRNDIGNGERDAMGNGEADHIQGGRNDMGNGECPEHLEEELSKISQINTLIT